MTDDTDQHPVAVAALIRKRADIAGIIDDLQKQITLHRADLAHIDGALRLLNSPLVGSDVPAKRHRPKVKGYFVHGELGRRIYDMLRERQEPISAGDLAAAAMADKGLGDDKEIRALFLRRFLVRLDQMALRGYVERIGGGNSVRWRLVTGAR